MVKEQFSLITDNPYTDTSLTCLEVTLILCLGRS